MEKLKHNHKLTDLLKVAMFSLVMLAPFLSIGVRCGYVMWNKNAKDSYSGRNEYILQPISNINLNNTYYMNYTDLPLQTYDSGKVDFSSINNVVSSNASLKSALQNIDAKQFQVFASTGNRVMYVYDNNGNAISSAVSFLSDNLSFDITITGFQPNAENKLLPYLYNTIAQENYYMDNAFSYSVSQISNDPIFNWTRNTGIYQPINAMVSGLEIENDTLQILLAYWSLMTAVYIVFDLIIVIFTKITHFIND